MITAMEERIPDGTVLDGEIMAWKDGPLPFAVLHELMAAGVPIEIARETALHAAETRQELLRARLEAEPLPPAVTIDRPRAQAALIVARMLDARPATVARSHANRWAVSYTHLTLPTNREV